MVVSITLKRFQVLWSLSLLLYQVANQVCRHVDQVLFLEKPRDYRSQEQITGLWKTVELKGGYVCIVLVHDTHCFSILNKDT